MQSVILIEPWAIVDLHKYEIEVDPSRGRMRVPTKQQTNSLRYLTIPSATLQINGPEALHKSFEAWLSRFPYPSSIKADSQHGLLTAGFALGEHRVAAGCFP
jgi:hypothetical protein